MQRARLLLSAIAVALLAATPTLAQDRPKRRIIPATRPATDIAASAATPTAPASSTPAPLRLGGLTGLTGLTGMTPVGDPAPACRAQCSKERYVCHAVNDPTDCDSRWIPCLHACSTR